MRKPSSNASVMDAQCPSRLVLDRIADKWTALIIQILARGTMRYAALQREIGGISQKMLTQTLRSLERDGLVQRTVHPVVPPKVEYAITRLGRTLIEPLHALCRWSEKHLPELQANRARARAKATRKEAVAAVADRGLLTYR
ncbi:MAG TPA: transcriptional regulator [Spartobacteria bacterium]|jgi:DNA-binding HxlR family transcriptional regulator|nr:transcriptional regulator [Spartobacteria bacterium]